ncbi:DUF6478 family protein [Paracoccus luteus]|uniref:DUF6478 family protein n=1 Tax=Paracoccus luteus TaxID=2508543 RepID=UPI00106F7801|nr:DUF6478 family protein [Paracoccus luteus]
MAGDLRGWARRQGRARAARQWTALAEAGTDLPSSRLRRLSDEARALRLDLDRFLARARARLDRIPRVGADVPGLPAGTDWHWRPTFLSARLSPSGHAAPRDGTRLGDEAAVWHDCPNRALILRQSVNREADDLSPFGLRLETMGFTGSFLSISVDLPQAALDGLSRSHIIRLAPTLSVERPMSIYARLNVGHGPNTDELLRHLGDLTAGPAQGTVIEFDLYYLEMNEKRLHKVWLDLIFETPQMNAVVLRDLFLSRHLRAEI